MKHFIAFLLVIACFAGFAQPSDLAARYDKIEKFKNGLAIVKKDGLYGVINKQGEELYKPQFESISRFREDGRAYTRINGLVGVVDTTGFVIAYNHYQKIGSFNGGYAFMKREGKLGLMNEEGVEIIKPEYENISRFKKNGLARTRKNGLLGLVDKNGYVVLDNLYNYIGRFRHHAAIVGREGLYGVINENGELIVELQSIGYPESPKYYSYAYNR